MKALDSPASTILVTNSEGARYDIRFPFTRVERWRVRTGPSSKWLSPTVPASRRHASQKKSHVRSPHDHGAQWVRRSSRALPALQPLEAWTFLANRGPR